MGRQRTNFANTAVVTWASSRCMALTTFRRDGTAVVTPVWFVTDGANLCLWTDAASGKVKRLRQDPRCTVAPCAASGRLTGLGRDGRARLLGEEDGEHLQVLLRAKYPIQKRALDAYSRLRRRGRLAPQTAPVYLAISLTD